MNGGMRSWQSVECPPSLPVQRLSRKLPGCSNRSAWMPPLPRLGSTQNRSVGAANRNRSGAEQSARTAAIASVGCSAERYLRVRSPSASNCRRRPLDPWIGRMLFTSQIHRVGHVVGQGHPHLFCKRLKSFCPLCRSRHNALQLALQIAPFAVFGNCRPTTSGQVRPHYAVPCRPVKPPVSLSHG